MTRTPLQNIAGAFSDTDRLPDETLVNMRWIMHISGLSDKWFYRLIKRGEFMPPMKFGHHSRWRAGDIYAWLDNRYYLTMQEQVQNRQAFLDAQKEKP